MGEIREAQKTWSDAPVLAERTLRPEHPAFAELLRKSGLAAFSLGNLQEARELRERTLRIGEQSLAPCDPALNGLLFGVANSKHYDGESAEARQLYRKATATIERCAGANAMPTDAYATAVFNQAEIAQDIGDFSEAERLYRRAVDIWSKGLGSNHPFVARGLDSLAAVASARGQHTRARTIYARVLAARQRSLGRDHPHVAWTLTNLARTAADGGDVPLALRYAEQAIAIYGKSGAADEPDHFARLLELRGMLEARQGQYTSARTTLTAALSERERVFGRSHPLVAETRATLASVDLAHGRFDAALTEALDAEHTGREHLRSTIRYLPERQALAYAAKRPRALDTALSIAAHIDDESARVLDALVRSRGVLLDEFAARARPSTAVDTGMASLNAIALSARQRFANLVVRSLREPVSRALLDEARLQKEEAERTLAEHSGAARADLIRASVGLDDVQRSLPAGTALVSFARYNRFYAASEPGVPRRRSLRILGSSCGPDRVGWLPFPSVPPSQSTLVSPRGAGKRRVPQSAPACLRLKGSALIVSPPLACARWCGIRWPHMSGPTHESM